MKSVFCLCAKYIFPFFLIFGFLDVVIAANHDNETDRLSLLAFKETITHDPFEVLRSWNETVPFCKWQGVICSSSGYVTSLKLQHKKLKGPISPHIGNLSFLNELLLDNNSFTGGIPPELSRLQNLKMLWLRNNSLDGEIPSNLSACSNLVEIRLSWNNLIGRIPAEFGYFSKLQLIQAPRNSLTGSIPRSFGNLSSLLFLGFSSNYLSGHLPNEIGNLMKLEYIGFNDNSLSGEFPTEIFNLSSLTTIFVSLNKFKGTLPPYLGTTLPNLYYIAISENSFSGPLPISLSNSSKLEYLFLDTNSLIGQVPTLEKLYKLSHFSISSNLLGSGGYDDLSFISSLTNATNLEELGLDDNNFAGVIPEPMKNLSTKLTGFLLSNNHLSGPIPSWLERFTNLTTIRMSNNQFIGTIPSDIGRFQKLQVLDLSHNRFRGTIPSALGNLSLLTKLDLNHNKLYGGIPISLGQCQNLQALNLSENNLNSSIPQEIFGLSSLTLYLDLSHNQFIGSLPVAIGNLKNLGVLTLKGNRLSGEIPGTLGSCVRLEELSLEGNYFRGSIPSLSSLRGLRILDLSNNNLSGQVPQYLGDFDLQLLNLSFNSFEGSLPTEGIFKNASAISVLGNSKLCGGAPQLQLPKCIQKESNKSFPTSTFKLSISIVCGVLGLALLFCFIIFYSCKRKKTRLASSTNHSLVQVSYRSLYQATDGFCSANFLGKGGFASVYKGVMENNGATFAVKVFNLLQRGASRSFLLECEVLKNFRHRNLVKVLTACSGFDDEGNDFKALVYEYMENGSLDDWLHPCPNEDMSYGETKKLSFLQRMNIAIDVSCALEYLHNQSHESVVHCDLKPSNVLLDDELVGHVSDFGLAKFLPTADTDEFSRAQTSSSTLRGSIGYTAPEYGIGSKVSSSGDIFSFGILLLEMFTGKRPTDDMFTDDLDLHNFVLAAFPNRLLEILDPVLLESNEMKRDKIEECVNSVLGVGLTCSAELARDRMNIADVVAELLSIRNGISGTSWTRPLDRNR
ncbi:PREDICTED: probable LRR receptor-like serine/threonine-protein kinase At3g47570 [Nicotiana attenuata]|uniref:non-specific serine/threonine protein kinase n=1 Tax=Nicotiana attenuata TaxID=49451 RepID=A0A314KJY3_NICAT|nr:PREDICTED: probable LRR receptor-like serine/threonine-protein kinase At3g47570 [Nicotiana attenuata]OIT29573.1 putative lrr receptor-like serinethreonine-protein kinase [Nicotiana attenuata]